eukprot:COSAG06_NODE_8523_length_2140_cov_12.719745_3_plen_177_part_01
MPTCIAGPLASGGAAVAVRQRQRRGFHLGKKSASSAPRLLSARRASARVSGLSFDRERGEIETPPRRLRGLRHKGARVACESRRERHLLSSAWTWFRTHGGGGAAAAAERRQRSKRPHLRVIFLVTGMGEQSGGRVAPGAGAAALEAAAASCASSALTCSTRASMREKLSRRRRGAR